MDAQSVFRLPQVMKQVSLSRSTIYTLQKQGKFPKAVQLGERSVGWLSGEIAEWLAERAAARQEAA